MPIKLPTISKKWMIFSVTANGTFMANLSAGIVNIALPTMASQFSVSLEHIQLVVSLHMLVLTSFLPIFGKLSDLYSRKWMYLGGFITFGIGSLLGALSTSLTTMLIARSIQGLGSSAMMATSQALITQVFHGTSRGKAFGAIGAVVACGGLAGPALGGFLIELWGWPSVFWISIPVCILGVWRGIYLIPRFKSNKPKKMDPIGAFFYCITSLAFLYALNTASSKGWTSPFILSLFILSILFFVFFWKREKIAKHSFMGLSIFKIPAISYGCIVATLGYSTLFCNSVLLPFYLADILHFGPVKIGLLSLPFPLTLALSCTLAGTLCSKWPARIITTIGFVGMLIASLLFAFIGDHPTIFYIVLAQLIMGAGSGTFQVPNNNTVLSAAPKSELGVVASVNALARNVGMLLGIALSVAIFSLCKTYLLNKGISFQPSFLSGYKMALLFGAFCAVVGGIVSFKRN